ncbi:MAG: sulfatase [Thermoplasmata archaeon]
MLSQSEGTLSTEQHRSEHFRRRPNVLIVVLDCVRSTDFPGVGEIPRSMPLVESLKRRSITFPKAVAPSSWTLPSHASLFTGLYPWEHGAHLRVEPRLDGRSPTLAEVLRADGYAAASFSANGLICSNLGLVRGFDVAAWGQRWERYFRFSSWWERSHLVENGSARNLEAAGDQNGEQANPPRKAALPSLSRLESRLRETGISESRVRATALRTWLARSWNLASQVGLFLDEGSAESSIGRISPWIEPSLASWVQRQPRERPVFCFINFFEAHEPYLIPFSRSLGLTEWWRRLAIPSDGVPLIGGQWRPNAWEFNALHEAYQAAVRSLDARLREVIRVFQDAERWDNTLMILTSDHGQAFGEHGFFGHSLLVWEPLVRVPLLVRLPRDEFGGATGTGWTSLIDVFPTVLEVCGASGPSSPHAISLRYLIDNPRPTPLLTMADGVIQGPRLRKVAGEARFLEWDSPLVAAYQDEEKVIADVHRERVEWFDLRRDPGEAHGISRPTSERSDPLVRLATEVATKYFGFAPGNQRDEVMENLRSWGYE